MRILALCINSRDCAKVLKVEICSLVQEKLGVLFFIYHALSIHISNSAVAEATKKSEHQDELQILL
jgi:hypothetical protein